MVCGLPGAGKTTTARRIASDIGAVRMCPDEWMIELGIDLWDEHARARIESLQWLVTTDLLRLGTNVVIEWGLWSREERDVLRTNARELGAPVELHFLVEDVDVLWERIERRQMSSAGERDRSDAASWRGGCPPSSIRTSTN